ncbi:MAG: hypothetical protein N4J56_002311 [Chroococcidiopsis sp. SAG 2025]|uniref:hypothetical protein n=1 Tax=Chroococcidiopsis sp. SAG 2025 TaxID=171389 RepID=UPI00293747A8|nr:hypothetical protein [Chroococcidiopsis sp. SAG 2025]MDV2992657.1 hypothetical protein [Chroococcidiopsis sp. SAG 2025]
MTQDFSQDFGSFEDAIWLNCAHQGALPLVSAHEAYEAITWKITPQLLTTERY